MIKRSSRFLSVRQMRGMERIGDVYFPGDVDFPSFSACGCVSHADVALEGLPDDDRRSLLTLLNVLGALPAFVARVLVAIAERGTNWPGPLGTGARLLRFGLRGIVTTLYYSGECTDGYEGPSPLACLGYDVKVFTGDVEERERQESAEPSSARGSVAACRGLAAR